MLMLLFHRLSLYDILQPATRHAFVACRYADGRRFTTPLSLRLAHHTRHHTLLR